MKIIVTGGMGHIGSKLIRDLPKYMPDLVEILVLDDLTTQRYPSLFDLGDSVKYRFKECDVTMDDLVTLFAGADLVVHLAAITDATSSVDNPDAVEAVNYLATEKVAQACLSNNVRMVMASTTSIYGTQDDYVDEDCSPNELRPQSPYAVSKFREENRLRELVAEQGLQCLIFRFGTIAGASPGMRFHTAVNKFCWQAVLGQELTVWSTAYDQKRPYLSLDDAVQAVGFFADKTEEFDGRIYNVVTENLTVRQICDMVREEVGNLKIGFVDAKIMNQLSYEVGAQKIEAAGFRHTGTIRDSIKETIRLLRPLGDLS